MQLNVNVDFELGDIVYLKIDDSSNPGMVTEIRIFPGNIMYGVTWTNKELTPHYGIELTTTRNFVVPETIKDDGNGPNIQN